MYIYIHKNKSLNSYTALFHNPLLENTTVYFDLNAADIRQSHHSSHERGEKKGGGNLPEGSDLIPGWRLQAVCDMYTQTKKRPKTYIQLTRASPPNLAKHAASIN